MPAGVALLAVGGFGRGELFPHSDVDVLLLMPDGISCDTDAALKQRVETFIGSCWDAGLEIGSSVRTVAECLAESAGAYKPQMRAFEYMFDQLGCGPEDVLHVSSSFRYDLMTAHDLGIRNKVWVNRGHEPANPHYGYTEVRDISDLAEVVGL